MTLLEKSDLKTDAELVSEVRKHLFDAESKFISVASGIDVLTGMAMTPPGAGPMQLEAEEVLWVADQLQRHCQELKADFYAALHCVTDRQPSDPEVKSMDPAVDAAKALARAQEVHRDLWDRWWDSLGEGNPEANEPPQVRKALKKWEGLQLALAQTPAKTVWGVLAKADFLAEFAEGGTVLYQEEMCRSIRDDIERLRKERD